MVSLVSVENFGTLLPWKRGICGSLASIITPGANEISVTFAHSQNNQEIKI